MHYYIVIQSVSVQASLLQKHSLMGHRIYPRGFVLSRESTKPPAGFIAGPIFDNLFIDDLNSADSASKGEVAVVVLGTCVSTVADEPSLRSPDKQSESKRPFPLNSAPDSPARHMLDALLVSEERFFDTIDQYCGRHVILYGKKDKPRIVTDATGMRTVFYAAEGGVVASHPRLVEETLGGEIIRIDLPFRYGFPGNHTPYVRTRLLTPNTLYDFVKAKVVRFWPRGPIKELTPQEAAEIVLKRAETALKRAAMGRRVSLSITAGLDSRTVLALALHSGIQFDGYTYDRGKRTSIDCEVARELARISGITHNVVPTPTSAPEELKGLLNRTTYYNHHHSVITPMQQHFASNDILTVTANLLEIGRFFYKGQNYADKLPENPESMSELALAATNWSEREMDEMRGSKNKNLIPEYFSDFIRDTNFNAARGILDSRDQFYWEHRMSAWHGMILLERDFYADCFIPFNSRSIFEVLLGVPEADRKNSTVFKMLIDKCAPQLLSNIPINPTQWPLRQRSTEPSKALPWLKMQACRLERELNANGLGSLPRLYRRALRALGK